MENMNALIPSRLFVFAGESFCFQKLPRVYRSTWFHSGVFSLSKAELNQGPLTLASLGFKSEFQNTDKSKVNKVTELDSPRDVPKSRVKIVRNNEKKVVGVRKMVEAEMAPFSAKSFSELGLPALLIERLEIEGFTVPTDIQSASIPTILKNHDVVIQSYTGSGKTLAYILPILSEIGPFKNTASNYNDEPGKKKEIEAVIVAPSRELGMQIVREFEKILGPANRKVVQQLVGGANRTRQEEALKKNKPAIVVGTPGRIAEISASGRLHTHGCSFLILDEVDELLSFNFREDMHRILEHVGRRSGANSQGSENAQARRVERQLVMVSATVPFSVVRAAKSWGCDPLLVKANKVAPLDSVPLMGPVNPRGPSSGPTSNTTLQNQTAIDTLPPSLKHYYCTSRLQHKVDMLRRCVHALDAKFVMVFMNHTKQLRDVVFKLKARGMNAAELHGDLGKLGRSTTLKSFKNGEIRVLVTNELSARGLDIAECDLVVNLDLPTDSIHYAHRAGRTGRLGRMGTVVSICEEPEVFVVKKLQKQLGVPILACDFIEGKLVDKEKS